MGKVRGVGESFSQKITKITKTIPWMEDQRLKPPQRVTRKNNIHRRSQRSQRQFLGWRGPTPQATSESNEEESYSQKIAKITKTIPWMERTNASSHLRK
jgi:hypothetical protein